MVEASSPWLMPCLSRRALLTMANGFCPASLALTCAWALVVAASNATERKMARMAASPAELRPILARQVLQVIDCRFAGRPERLRWAGVQNPGVLVGQRGLVSLDGHLLETLLQGGVRSVILRQGLG